MTQFRKKVFVTGATGFVGRHVAQQLTQSGVEVYALVRSPQKAKFLKKEGVYFVVGDLQNVHRLQKDGLPEFDAIIHLAGLIKAKTQDEFYEVNVGGTENLIEAFGGKSISKFVLVSSIAARGPNLQSDDHIKSKGSVSHYGKSKLLSEQTALDKLNPNSLVIFRPPVVYGPHDLATLTLFKMFKKGVFPVLGQAGKVSFVYVEDLSRLLVMAALQNVCATGLLYPEDGQGGYTWEDVIECAEAVFQRKIYRPSIPIKVGQILATCSEFSGKIFRFTPMFSREKFQEMKQPYWFCSAEDCVKHYDWQGRVKLQQGLSLTKAWYENQGWL